MVILPVAWGLSRTIGPTGVWHAFWITEVVAAVVAWAVYRRALRSPAPQRETPPLPRQHRNPALFCIGPCKKEEKLFPFSLLQCFLRCGIL